MRELSAVERYEMKTRRRGRTGVAGSSIYVRCRFCGREFYGNSDDVLKEWQEHEDSCEKNPRQAKNIS